MHGDHGEASTPDNSHKQQIRVYRGYGVDPATGRHGYALHWRRAQEGNVKELLAKWRASTAAQRFRLATATAKRPQGVLLGPKQLVKWRCLCVKLRAATFADCKICSFVEEGIRLWHTKRFGRRREVQCTAHYTRHTAHCTLQTAHGTYYLLLLLTICYYLLLTITTYVLLLTTDYLLFTTYYLLHTCSF